MIVAEIDAGVNSFDGDGQGAFAGVKFHDVVQARNSMYRR